MVERSINFLITLKEKYRKVSSWPLHLGVLKQKQLDVLTQIILKCVCFEFHWLASTLMEQMRCSVVNFKNNMLALSVSSLGMDCILFCFLQPQLQCYNLMNNYNPCRNKTYSD